MPRKTKTAAADPSAVPLIPAEVLEQNALRAEMSQHLGYAPGQAKPECTGNHRNGECQDGADRHRRVGLRGAARSTGQFRRSSSGQGREAFYRVRRQDRGHSCARHDGARDPPAAGADTLAATNAAVCLRPPSAWQARRSTVSQPVPRRRGARPRARHRSRWHLPARRAPRPLQSSASGWDQPATADFKGVLAANLFGDPGLREDGRALALELLS